MTTEKKPFWLPVAAIFGPVLMVGPQALGIPVPYPVALACWLIGAYGVASAFSNQNKRILQLEKTMRAYEIATR
jgi:hypothetical protein